MYFKKFFKIPIGLFDDIVAKVIANNNYFSQKTDAVGKMGLSSVQKICSAVRQLTSCVSSAEHDDKFLMGASTGLLEAMMKRFCHSVIEVYGDEALLRHPHAVDIGQLLDKGCAAGFPSCIGSIDCMHWEWKNCPSSWKGMFQGKSGVLTVVLEAIAENSVAFGISTLVLQGHH
ncbi:Plant transposon protein [Fragilaria crotonensis]|nr:Plant transposon protein [Fragilaria crotonensis]